ncbi:triose-phosphate isomerase [candidate division LCP-89 bacterium B3_LCP]|uniref:Triosephosphate isomerase n=1 Tax=candidate division LCP-89 bacterium B3_LCP TaxID=2012998 RepID=A0A532UZ80_UNCL8|nr:MAG: triose-phosphate isomerase [candidate division LCP-89 bacterium B3_LCP]
MRRPFIAGNWKMSKNLQESVSLAKSLKNRLKNVKNRDILICPSFTALGSVYDEVKGSNIKLGAQNMYFEDKGAYTGEVSPLMLKDFCEYVILGHSERRQYFDESDEKVNKKVKKALEHGLRPILCVGESLEQREKNETFDIVGEQLEKSLKGVNKNSMKRIIIAYEPVWAIGTGKNATPEQAEDVHVFIRKEIEKIYGKGIADDIRILYGGSVKPDNIKDLMEKESIDGVLVGGASLDAESFSEIVDF